VTGWYLTGASILEIIIATTIIAVGLVAALSLATNSQKSSDYSRDNNLATNYSYQVVDWLRDIKTTLGWTNLVYYIQADAGGNSSITYCLNSTLPTDETSFEALTTGSDCTSSTIPNTVFSRELTLDISSDSLSGTVTTYWQEKVQRSNTIELELTKW